MTNPLFAKPDRINIASVIEGEPMLSVDGMQLLFGVGTELISAHFKRSMKIPDEWVKSGRRRAKEAQASTGVNAMVDGLIYWARKDHGADIIEESDGSIWMVRSA